MVLFFGTKSFFSYFFLFILSACDRLSSASTSSQISLCWTRIWIDTIRSYLLMYKCICYSQDVTAHRVHSIHICHVFVYVFNKFTGRVHNENVNIMFHIYQHFGPFHKAFDKYRRKVQSKHMNIYNAFYFLNFGYIFFCFFFFDYSYICSLHLYLYACAMCNQ